MRALYVSVVLFLLMLGVIASSMVMNRHVCKEMQQARRTQPLIRADAAHVRLQHLFSQCTPLLLRHGGNGDLPLPYGGEKSF